MSNLKRTLQLEAERALTFLQKSVCTESQYADVSSVIKPKFFNGIVECEATFADGELQEIQWQTAKASGKIKYKR